MYLDILKGDYQFQKLQKKFSNKLSPRINISILFSSFDIIPSIYSISACFTFIVMAKKVS